MSNSLTVTDTTGFIELVRCAQGRNRAADLSVIDILDPDGLHVLAFQMLHNDVEWRTLWLTKVKNNENPVELWLDVGFDTLATVQRHIDPDSFGAAETREYEH